MSDLKLSLDESPGPGDNNTDWSAGDVITLNVGGRLFQTRVSTLIATANLFTTLIEGSKKGEVLFIDRDPDYFAVILNYLRTGLKFLPPMLAPSLMEQEYNYYLLGKPVNSVYDSKVIMDAEHFPQNISTLPSGSIIRLSHSVRCESYMTPASDYNYSCKGDYKTRITGWHNESAFTITLLSEKYKYFRESNTHYSNCGSSKSQQISKSECDAGFAKHCDLKYMLTQYLSIIGQQGFVLGDSNLIDSSDNNPELMEHRNAPNNNPKHIHAIFQKK